MGRRGLAFIRVFNASNQPKVAAQVGSKSLGDVSAMEASSYTFLPPGQYPVKIGDASDNTTLQGSHCYTAAIGADSKVHQFDQQCFGHRAGQFSTVVTGQHCQQQIEHRHPAARSQAITIPVDRIQNRGGRL